MKKTILLLSSLWLIGICLLQAQDKFVHIKAYGTNYYLSAGDSEGESAEVKKTDAPGLDEQFVLELVKEEKYVSHYHIRTKSNYYLIVGDDELMLGSKEKPAGNFHFVMQDENLYTVKYNGVNGLKISKSGELDMEGPTVSFITTEEVKEGQEVSTNLLRRPHDYSFRLTVFTSNGAFTETSSNIHIEVFYYKADTWDGTAYQNSMTISSGDIGRIGNRSASVSFDFSEYAFYINKIVITNKGGGINENWKVDWFQLDEYRNGSWEKVERMLMGYWVNKGESMSYVP